MFLFFCLWITKNVIPPTNANEPRPNNNQTHHNDFSFAGVGDGGVGGVGGVGESVIFNLIVLVWVLL